MIRQFYKKYQKGKTLEVIADEVEEDAGLAEDIIKIIQSLPEVESDPEAVYEKLKEKLAEAV